ncbi:monovalent cation:proton antiporter-2 (CPA2) family protein [Lentibacter algarum]|uniref:monovalent cation:proton antiporter-2 (CPA2) family protein n=1 Tax=Lentibacter algarum TaxID=576131 RepID=UPI001C0800B9|nr:monovalent cation:proton antiporter-2 (CPA2) family protein [Lentibacter algarum]MBU2983325.1 monovalent cation:proton antiporter-2 (CPA2) family protein [Lentibacter algarum]
MHSLLLLPTLYLLAAVIAVPLAARLGLGSVLGYLSAGMIIGLIPGIGEETRALQHFAEFGVVMMLFIVGLELAPRTLWGMRHKLLGLGGSQILLSTLIIFAVAVLLDEAWQTSLAIGLVLALSSTAIVLQTLTEKGLMKTSGGRSVFSVLLTQDISIVPLLALIPLLSLANPTSMNADGSITRLAEEAEKHHTIFEGLPAWGVALATLATIALIIAAGVFLTKPIFRFIHAAHLREMYTALALLIVIGIAYLMTLLGLSPALGAFLAGVVLASSEFRHELESDIEPFKGLLLGLFFITVGASVDFATLTSDPLRLVNLALALILVKGAVLFALGFGFGLRKRELWLFTLSLAQAGEFGFVLISFASQQGVFGPALGGTLTLVITLSMLATPLLFLAFDYIAKRQDKAAPDHTPDEIDTTGPVIIAGIGRFGQIVNRLVESSGFKTVVLDHDLERIQLMRSFGYRAFLGDPTRPELLRAAGLRDARVLVVALNTPDAALRLVKLARKERPDLHIIARARDRSHVFALYEAGANDIVREMFDSSLRAGRYVLENVGLSEFEAAEAEQAFFAHDREALKELAALWKPGMNASANPAYMARVRELEKELEVNLLALAEKQSDKAG